MKEDTNDIYVKLKLYIYREIEMLFSFVKTLDNNCSVANAMRWDEIKIDR